MPYIEPDWESLSEINFILYRRMSEHLNAALAAISLLGAPEAPENPEFWRERALSEVMNSLGLHNAWASLVRFRLGEQFQAQNLMQFTASEMLDWLSAELQLSSVEPLEADILLFGNRESLQEALLLLHSCASMFGPGVTLQAQIEGRGMWFRVRYQSMKLPPPSLDALIASLERLPETWRNRNCVFELKRARDFLRMNNCDLLYTVEGHLCELAFFVPAVALFDQGSGKAKKFELSGDDTSVMSPKSFMLNDYVSTSSAGLRAPRSGAPSASTD